METLAFVHVCAAYEDPTPAPEFRMPVSVTQGAAAGVAVGMALLTVSTDAMAAVRRTDRGAGVVAVQQALVRKGHSVGQVDGVFGGKTQYAVMQFQRRNGLKADGVVGAETARLLGINTPVASATPTTGTGGGGGTPSTARVSTRGAGLRVRQSASATAPVINRLPNGASVQLTGRKQGGWVELRQGGWVSSSWLK